MTKQSGAIAGLPVPGLEAAASNDQIQLFDFSVDLLQALLWQYNEATNLQSLLEAKSDWYVTNQTDFWTNWYADVFNVETATQFGLAVWSIILGLPLYVNNPPYAGKPTWGFGDANGDVNFDNGNFTDSDGSSHLLPLETQRIAIQLRYYQLTSSGTLPEINRAMKWIFGGLGKVYLIDYHNMTQAFIFDFAITADLIYLFNNYDILPRPAGVGSNYIDNTLVHFGFNSFNDNFDLGNFGA